MRLTALALVPVLALLASCIPEAHATPPLEVVRALPAVGPGYVDSFSVACATSATAITPPGGSPMLSYTCQSSGTTKVAVGDASIADPTDAQNSPIYCATNCPSQEFGGNAKLEYCRADTGTVTIYCRALVATSP